ncbi:outer membrane protein [Methyloferula stellata]|uniref:outer membrane protein n=1 Tax=Methyloferula stellata TaxID=876270 RepID=UPI0003662F9B|nr:outer membrane protein [Methyloferula stellata]
MIRKFSMATAVLMAASASAFAADLPRRTPPPVFVPPPLFTWTGLYVGGQVGYAWGKDNSNGVLSAVGVGPFGAYTNYNSPNGEVGGAHIGYNYQFNQFVIGVEGDVNGSNFNNGGTGFAFGAAGIPFGAFSVNTATRIPIEGSARARIGFAWDHWLFFATGGAAFADIEHSFALGVAGVGFFNDPATYSKTRVGWTVGGGVEYALNNNWSVRAEYRYSDYGTNSSATLGGITALTGVYGTQSSHLTESKVQVGFSYKFDWYTPPAPVVAKY